MDDLKLTKTRLERAKTIIRQRSDSDIEAINQQIKNINNKIIELQNRKKDWIKISIDDDSDGAEESE